MIDDDHGWCPKCECGMRSSGSPHLNSRVCKAEAAANRLRAKGLVPVAPTHLWGSESGISTTTRAAASMLRALGFRTVLADTNFYSSGTRCWTTQAGYDVLEAVQHAKSLLATLSMPEIVRRAIKHPGLLDRFDAARRLGAKDVHLDEILMPLRRRPR